MKKAKKAELNLATLKAYLPKIASAFGRYGGIMFFLLVSAVYGFVILRINTLGDAQPDQSQVDALAKSASVPRIDPKIVKQLESLEDNSVNVQTLFDEARNNPFQ